jgi:para-aminobenzoate synthetase component 1
VPIARPATLSAPLEIPPARLARVIGAMREPALLESGPGFGGSGRWSILTAEPRLVFEADAASWQIEEGGHVKRSGRTDPLNELGRLLREFRLADPGDEGDPNDSPFCGGLIGFFSYDLAPQLERLPRQAPADSRIPIIRFGLYDWAVIIDHSSAEVRLSVFDLLSDGVSARCEYFEALRQALSTRPAPPRASELETPISSNFTPADYLAGVERVLEYIRAGDIFQANLSQRFIAHGRIEPLDLYLRLKACSPAPFAAYLQWRDLAVVSASPESFYDTRGNRLITRPIKGTRPRGRAPDDDARLAAELLSSAKDRAELTMIVDLERNDLGRVCEYGSVRVRAPLEIESFAQVHHLVATVDGRIRKGAGPIDIVRALHPGGSITGAPKIRAMEIIDELEPTRRSLYTGAIGYFSRGGSSAFNIAIRTLLVEGRRVSYQVGGGIVADSNPQTEFEETLHKGRGLRAALEGYGRPA